MGDLNAQHPLWGSGSSNRNGTVLFDFISDSNLICANNGKPTRLTAPDQHKSVPDIVLISPSLVDNFSVYILCTYSGMSDNFPIGCSLQTVIDHTQSRANSCVQFATKKANWPVFSDLILEDFAKNKIISYETLENSILKSAEVAIPKFRNAKRIEKSMVGQ